MVQSEALHTFEGQIFIIFFKYSGLCSFIWNAVSSTSLSGSLVEVQLRKLFCGEAASAVSTDTAARVCASSWNAHAHTTAWECIIND